MSIRFYKGYWTLFSGEAPIASFANFERAWRMVWEIAKEAEREFNFDSKKG
jgi:hypothetical protein